MELDEFNLVCYASMYGNLRSTINDRKNNQGNFFEYHILIITVHIKYLNYILIK